MKLSLQQLICSVHAFSSYASSRLTNRGYIDLMALLRSSRTLSHSHCSLCTMIIICYVFSQPWPDWPDTPLTCLGWILFITQLQQEKGHAPLPACHCTICILNLCHCKSEMDILYWSLFFFNSLESVIWSLLHPNIIVPYYSSPSRLWLQDNR